MSNKWGDYYSVLVSWLNKNNYKVIEGCREEDRIDFEDKTIYINSQYKPENKLYTLLHESGHYSLNKYRDGFLKSHPVYPSGVSDHRKKRSKSYKVCLIAEEMEAWKRGIKIAKRFDFVINEEKYFKEMVKSVWSYVKWASR